MKWTSKWRNEWKVILYRDYGRLTRGSQLPQPRTFGPYCSHTIVMGSHYRGQVAGIPSLVFAALYT